MTDATLSLADYHTRTTGDLAVEMLASMALGAADDALAIDLVDDPDLGRFALSRIVTTDGAVTSMSMLGAAALVPLASLADAYPDGTPRHIDIDRRTVADGHISRTPAAPTADFGASVAQDLVRGLGDQLHISPDGTWALTTDGREVGVPADVAADLTIAVRSVAGTIDRQHVLDIATATLAATSPIGQGALTLV